MTIKQRILKIIYPLFRPLSTAWGQNNKIVSHQKTSLMSFYHLSITLNNGSTLSFESLKGKRVLLVNTASECGYTPQYEGLQQLYNQYRDSLIVIAFPSNEFGAQEPGTNAAIQQFCQKHYAVSFPIAEKCEVKKGAGQHEIYQWLTDENKNGWNSIAPTWNFCKYLVDEQGQLTHFFEAAIAPMGSAIINALENTEEVNE